MDSSGGAGRLGGETGGVDIVDSGELQEVIILGVNYCNVV